MGAEEARAETVGRVVQACRALIAGDAGVILTARLLSSLGHRLGEEDDPAFVTFRGIDSETDHLPAGQERQHWAPDALAREDQEIERVEAWYREAAIAAAHELLNRLAHT